MIQPDPRAGGCFLSLTILAGFFIGMSRGNPVQGVIFGTLAGIGLAIAVWLFDRSRPRR